MTSLVIARSGTRRSNPGCVRVLLRLRRGLARQPALPELAGLLQDRIGDRGQVRVDALEVAQDIEVQRAGLDALDAAASQALQMPLGSGALALAELHLLLQELARHLDVAGHEQRE